MLTVILLIILQASASSGRQERQPSQQADQRLSTGLRQSFRPRYRTLPPSSTTTSRAPSEGIERRAPRRPGHKYPCGWSQTKDNNPTSTAKVITSAGPFGTVQILASTKGPQTGYIPSSLETRGHLSTQPILTSIIPQPTSLLSTSSTISVPTTSLPTVSTMPSRDIFADPIATDAPPSAISTKKDHPVPRLGIKGTAPLSTNKFYANFFLGSQTAPSYLHPYSVAWAQGKGASASWGIAISHIEPTQRVYGQTNPTTGAASYFINPVGIQSVCISAKELGAATTLTTESLTDFSVRVCLRPSATAQAAIQFPLVQGSAFITAIFNGASPLIQTGVFYKTVTRSTREAKPGVTKYKLHLEDGTTWLLYAYHTKGDALDLQVTNNGLAESKGPFYGVIQAAKDPGNGETMYDEACGTYPTDVELSGNANDNKGTYTLAFKKAGMLLTTLAMFALPHHQSSFDDATRANLTSVKLQTTTKGMAAAVMADSWTMVEDDLPVNMSFVPWSPKAGSISTLSSTAKTFIRNIAMQEVSQNILQQTNQNSMYFSGKALAKFATVLMSINDILGDKALAEAGLNQLKVAFSRFSENMQQYPLVYESAWGGVVSSATYVTGNSGADFGNTYYNDHHFHYGYFIYCAAVIGHLDPTWLTDANKAYVNMLVRDVANPSAKDKFFPVWRCFDWFHGHSWAHGLFETLDGKDQESSSEDSMHAYAIKMWGTVSGDQNMAARGNLMLAIQARAIQAYYLYTSNNTVQPAQFIGNKAAGILFENKLDHTTYFGTNIEYIQGIHMLPLLPHTPLVRTPDFVAEEWNTYFGNGRAADIVGGWKGILYGNYATIDPRGAYAFFSSPGFDPSWLDGGASLTWYLCYSAGMSFSFLSFLEAFPIGILLTVNLFGTKLSVDCESLANCSSVRRL
ncbi:glycoside hydrolase family 81 protein [Lasiosphaeria miniovina]|uniref:glucan endo-1,3-beta-D-glucosidase n=1 Tax=Lasiosphaeria miniovina TaxID=1954250 RepID=A0AA40A5R0_9PEZI|nr:glycoside hydrolase family 81 protein [Lasiosphaeria miniovina]KAK0709705.1 glycoside hydrolase family 81 protein [Lasiosphaeria miniovina]